MACDLLGVGCLRACLKERRRHPRIAHPDVLATIVFGTGQSVRCAIEDLSVGGARVQLVQALAIGDRVQLVLDHTGVSRAVSMIACVTRVQPSSQWNSIALTFVSLADPVREVITLLVRRTVVRRRHVRAGVLVVDDEREVGAALERDLTALGFLTRTAATPLDAIRILQDATAPIQIVLIDLGLGPADGVDVLHYLAAEYRNLRRVVMSRRRAHELEGEVEAGRAHGALRKPWTPAALEAAVIGHRQRNG